MTGHKTPEKFFAVVQSSQHSAYVPQHTTAGQAGSSIVRKICIGVIVAVVLLVIIGAIVAAVMLMKGSSNNQNQPTSTSFEGAVTVINDKQLRQDLLLPESAAFTKYQQNVCSNVITILKQSGDNPDVTCEIVSFRRSDYVLRYRVSKLSVSSSQTEADALTAASTRLVQALSGSYFWSSALNVNKSSVIFYQSDNNGNSVAMNCGSASCSLYDANSVCMSVISGYTCVCAPRYQISSATTMCDACGPDSTRCTNGVSTLCVAKCDGRLDCQTGDDELNCPCTTSQYQCSYGSSYICQDQTTWCDGKQNCPDRSDEQSCNSQSIVCPKESIGLCKATGRCLFPIHRCNWFQDCPDDFDEINCTCPSYGYPCQNGRCIYKSWLCDGNKDCPLGDDESSTRCRTCDPVAQIRCASDNSCIDIVAQCDGTAQCSDSSDESQCFSFRNQSSVTSSGSLLNVKLSGQPGYYVCADTWTQALSDRVCQQNGYSYSQSTTSVLIAAGTPQFLTLRSTTNPNLISGARQANCTSGKAVVMTCAPTTCGRKPMASAALGYIVNGQQAPVGAWPWQVQMFAKSLTSITGPGRFFCGAELVYDRWVMTAAHCVTDLDTLVGYNGVVRPESIYVRMGSISLNETSAGSVRREVQLVRKHPNYLSSMSPPEYDVALLKLASPAPLSDTIQPICLPSSTDVDLKQFKVCFNTGFGQTTAVKGSGSQVLLQTRMNILPYEACSAYKYLNVTRGEALSTLCVGTEPSVRDRNTGQGDSGGPLSCRDQNDIWTVIGINSYGDAENDYSISANVPVLVRWVYSTVSNNSP